MGFTVVRAVVEEYPLPLPLYDATGREGSVPFPPPDSVAAL